MRNEKRSVPGLRTWSPTVLLAWLESSWLPRSDGIGYIMIDMTERESEGRFKNSNWAVQYQPRIVGVVFFQVFDRYGVKSAEKRVSHDYFVFYFWFLLRYFIASINGVGSTSRSQTMWFHSFCITGCDSPAFRKKHSPPKMSTSLRLVLIHDICQKYFVNCAISSRRRRSELKGSAISRLQVIQHQVFPDI